MVDSQRCSGLVSVTVCGIRFGVADRRPGIDVAVAYPVPASKRREYAEIAIGTKNRHGDLPSCLRLGGVQRLGDHRGPREHRHFDSRSEREYSSSERNAYSRGSVLFPRML